MNPETKHIVTLSSGFLMLAGLAVLGISLTPNLAPQDYFTPASEVQIPVDAAPQTYNINTSIVTGFGGFGDDAIEGSVILNTKKIIISGSLDSNQNFGVTPVQLNGGGNGFIAQLDRTGRVVEKITRFADSAGQLELLPNGNFAVSTLEGVFVLSSNLDEIVWSDLFTTTVGREETYSVSVDAAPDGSIAVLYNKDNGNGKDIRVYDSNGNIKFTKNVVVSRMEDIAIDNAQVYVVGYNQRDGGECSQYQSPYMYTYDHTGEFVWKAYDWNQTQVSEDPFGNAQDQTNNCADTRGKLIEVAPDGNLVFIPTSDGGNTVIRWNSRRLWDPVTIIGQDYSSDPAGGAARTSHVVRMTPAGEVIARQVHSSRLNNASGNSITFEAVSFDQDGEILISGQSAFAIESRNAGTPGPENPGLSINGQLLPEYSGFEGFFMQLSPNLEKKRYLNTVSGTNCLSNNRTISAYEGLVFTGGDYQSQEPTRQCENMLVQNELQTSLVNEVDGFYTVFGDTSDETCLNDALNPSACDVCVEWQTLVDLTCEYNTPNQLPTVSLSGVEEGQQFMEGETIELTATFSDPEGFMRKASITGNFSRLIDQGQPFSSNTLQYSWTGLPAGTHYVYATARDSHATTDNELTGNRGSSTVNTDIISFEVIAQENTTTGNTTSSNSTTTTSTTAGSSVTTGTTTTSSATGSTTSGNNTTEDQDPISSAIENAGPNNGDGNNDGVLDSLQNNVSSFQTVNSTYVTVEVNPECATFTILNSQLAPDDTYVYPEGLIHIEVECNIDVLDIQTYWHGLENFDSFDLRKYTASRYIDLPGTKLITQINNNNVVKTETRIVDNSEFDLNPTVGIIRDPYGLGIIQQSNTVRTGGGSILRPIGFVILSFGLFSFIYTLVSSSHMPAENELRD